MWYRVSWRSTRARLALIALGLGALCAAAWGLERGRRIEVLSVLPLPDTTLVHDLRYSPDGEHLAAVCEVFTVHQTETTRPFETRIYHAATGQLAHVLPNACWSCAWSLDGRVLAVGSGTEAKEWSAEAIDLWDTTTWQRTGRLTRGAWRRWSEMTIGDLAFDAFGNLFAVESQKLCDEPPTPGRFQALVWWNAAAGGNRESHELAPRNDSNAFSVSAVPIADGTLVAIAYDRPQSGQAPIDLLLVRRGAEGAFTTTLRRTLFFPTPMKVQLSADGQHLALLGGDGVHILRLADKPPTSVLATTEYEWPVLDHPEQFVPFRLIDVSADGQEVAFLKKQPAVYSVADGQRMMDAPRSNVATALSPDGRRLAVSDSTPGRICEYRVRRVPSWWLW